MVPEGLVVFDEHDRYELWNRRYLELYADRADMITAACRFEDFLRAGLASSQYPEAKGREEEWLADRLARHALAENSHDQRSPNGRWIRIQERRTANGGSIGVRFDITHLKQREEALRAQNLRFDAALNNMSQGLCMFDARAAAGGLQRALRAHVRPAGGADAAGHDACRRSSSTAIASGLYAAPIAEQVLAAICQAIAARRLRIRIELSDGRVIVIKHQPMAGGGWVATHEDITEQRRIEARIAHMARHDALTDLPNRVLLRERLERGARAQRRATAAARRALPRSRPLQGGQRHARPPDRRRAAARRWRERLRELRARERHRSPASAATSSPSCRSATRASRRARRRSPRA